MPTRRMDQLVQEIEELDPEETYKTKFCMFQISKELQGHFRVLKQELQVCKEPACETLKGLIELKTDVTSHLKCDGSISRRFLDGAIEGNLVFAHIEAARKRGIHEGRFVWHGTDTVLKGVLYGVTNAGTHHPPVMSCENCDIGGHIEGRLVGVVGEGELAGSQVHAAYAISFDSGSELQDTNFSGTIEGVLITACKG